MPVRSADAEKEHTKAQADAAGEDKKAWAVSIEDGSYLDAAKERQEDVHAEDPTNCAFAILFELMFGNICLDCIEVSLLS